MATIEEYTLGDGRTVRYRVRYRTPERRQTDKRGFRTKKAAESCAVSDESAMSVGAYVAPSAGRITVAELYAT